MLPAILIAWIVALTPDPTPAGVHRVPAGTWGGQGISLEVGETGAKLEFDCARGAIPEPLAIDANGRFDQAGTWTRERPGPTRRGDETAGEPARYRGKLEGETLSLRIILEKDGKEIASYSATRGKLPRVHRCL